MPKRIAGSSRTVGLTGFKELQKTLEELPLEIAGPIVRKSFRAGANVVRDKAVQMAPRAQSEMSLSFSRAASKDDEDQQKAIHESIKVIQPRRVVRSRTEIVMIVWIRHALAHIFEYGTTDRFQKTTKRYTGKIEPHPFMRPALDIAGSSAISVIKEKTIQLIEQAARRIAKKNGSDKRK